MIPFVGFFIALLTFFAHKWFTLWRFSELFPGPTAWPIVGNSLQLGFNSYDYLQNMIKYVKKYDFQAFRIWIGSSLYVIITDPKDVEIVLSSQKHTEKFDDYRFLHDWIGNGLITSKGSTWFRQRRIVTPTFHFNILNDFHVTMSSNLNELIAKLNEFADSGEAFDVQMIINMATLDVICETAMGVRVNALNDHESDLVKAFHDASEMVYQRIFSAWKRYDLLFPLSKDYQTHVKAVTTLRNFNQTIITQRKEQLMAELNNPSADNSEIKKRKAFLDMLLTSSENGVSLTDREINDEVSTFVFAGHDTTAAAISFGLYNMSLHPKVQAIAFEEQVSIFGDDLERPPTYQELQNMKYMELFTKESQRFHPAVSFIGRHASEPLTLSNGLVIPKGASIGVLLYIMGQNPKIFDNPEVFDPYRFTTDNRAHKNPYEYVPFSAGPRNCVGQKFANNEMRLVLATIVRHFEILPPLGEPFIPKFAATATTHSDNGIWIRLKRRNLVA